MLSLTSSPLLPPPRTKQTRFVPTHVRNGHVASQLPSVPSLSRLPYCRLTGVCPAQDNSLSSAEKEIDHLEQVLDDTGVTLRSV